MSTPRRDDWSEGRFVRVGQALPLHEVDASGWQADLPAGQGGRGSFVSLTQPLPAVEGHFVCRDEEPPVWLELAVSFAAHTPPGKVIEHANRLLALLHAADPELGLTYDFQRSRSEGDEVILALSPRRGAGVEKRLRNLLAVVETEIARLSGPNRTVARLVLPDAA